MGDGIKAAYEDAQIAAEKRSKYIKFLDKHKINFKRFRDLDESNYTIQELVDVHSNHKSREDLIIELIRVEYEVKASSDARAFLRELGEYELLQNKFQ